MTIFFTGCTHYLHQKILDFENRPYFTPEEMTSEMIKTWNNQIGTQDIVYHLGDFALTSQQNTTDILDQLNGRIRLIKGNHDFSKTWDKINKLGLLDEYHEVGTTIKMNKNTFWLTHYPMEIGIRPKKWSLHSHIHSQPSKMMNQLNLGVDSQLNQLLNKPFGQLFTDEDIMTLVDMREKQIEELFLKERGEK